MFRAGSELRFVVPGEPVPKGRARVQVISPKGGGKPFVHTYTPQDTTDFEKRVQFVARAAASAARWAFSDQDRFQLTVLIVRTHWDKGGDWDNYVKACQDALNGIAYPDDRYVRGGAGAFGDPDPKRPRVEVCVKKIPNPRRK